ncbi:thioredoxin domain-containing protein [Paracoccus cavernae]|uniref:Thioredoxin domain-containing protein n=1 Tax=Paracoccus cavernae TaxID=1571207 RepID=A0ABT8DC92_9RHOB|nr:thioredoxin domain-containing protein [Paracoccus cavernae]
MSDSPSDEQQERRARARQYDRRTLIRTGLTASVITGGFYGLSRLIPEPPAPAGLAQILRDPHAPVLGNPDGDVTVVEYFDYQCSFCRSGHEALMAGILEDGNTRLLLRDWPIFGGISVYASQLVLGASRIGTGTGTDSGADGLAQYHKANAALMAIRGQMDETRIETALADAGVDPAAAMQGYLDNRRAWDSFMIRNDRQAVQMGFQGTPSFVIGTQTHSGVLSESALRRAIRRARSDGPIVFTPEPETAPA